MQNHNSPQRDVQVGLGRLRYCATYFALFMLNFKLHNERFQASRAFAYRVRNGSHLLN